MIDKSQISKECIPYFMIAGDFPGISVNLNGQIRYEETDENPEQRLLVMPFVDHFPGAFNKIGPYVRREFEAEWGKPAGHLDGPVESTRIVSQVRYHRWFVEAVVTQNRKHPLVEVRSAMGAENSLNPDEAAPVGGRLKGGQGQKRGQAGGAT